MFLLIDNYDSFVMNLGRYLEELGQQVKIVKNDQISISDVESALERGALEGIIISPGPKSPKDSGQCVDIVRFAAGRVPILGVCLGHQIISYCFGGKVKKIHHPIHGLISEISNNGQGVFSGLPSTFKATRYHSLIVDRDSIDCNFTIDAQTSDGLVMGIHHNDYPLYGVQFHPEAEMTEYGYDILNNFIYFCHQFHNPVTVRNLDFYADMAEIFSLFHQQNHAVFLESSMKNDQGKFSIIGLNPYLILKDVGGTCFVNGKAISSSFEVRLKEILKENQIPNFTKLPLISGGIGYFTYDFGCRKYNIKPSGEKTVSIPDALVIFYKNYIVADLDKKEIYVTNFNFPKDTKVLKSNLTFEQIIDIISSIRQKYAKNNSIKTFSGESSIPQKIHSDFSKEEYLNAIGNIIRYMEEGHIYVANMTRQIQVESEKPPFDTYLALRQINPAPFGCYYNGNFETNPFQIASVSPELFVKCKKRRIETRPIKGTRRRGLSPKEDEILKVELIHSEKDKRELMMIVDLERNDLSSVCEAGTVKVPEMFSIETHPTVYHLVSTVQGKLKHQTDFVDIFSSIFPGGSITGTPKKRAMEIIEEQEKSMRGLYTGSMGYVSFSGDFQFNIVIRTAIYQNGVYHIGTGGGITVESEGNFEFEETNQKAKAIIKGITDDSN